jgi:hypothetical protein
MVQYSITDAGYNTWQDTVLTNEPIIATGMTDLGIHVSPTSFALQIYLLPIHCYQFIQHLPGKSTIIQLTTWRSV